MGTAEYALAQMDLADAPPDVAGDAKFLVPPGARWPKNNGFLRVLPMLNFTRVILPQPGDLAVYTSGYVVEKDRLGFTRGQAALMAAVVHVDPAPADGEPVPPGGISVLVQSKPCKEAPCGYRHPLRVVPPNLFSVPGGGPFVYFYRRSTP